MSVVLVLLHPQRPEGFVRVIDYTKKMPDGLIPNRVIDYTPRLVTQKNVFRINCVMIPDSMVTTAHDGRCSSTTSLCTAMVSPRDRCVMGRNAAIAQTLGTDVSFVIG